MIHNHTIIVKGINFDISFDDKQNSFSVTQSEPDTIDIIDNSSGSPITKKVDRAKFKEGTIQPV